MTGDGGNRANSGDDDLEVASPGGTRQHELFERFFSLSLDLMCIAGVDGYFKRLNPAFDGLGYSRDELLSRPFLDFVHPDDVGSTLAEVAKLAQGIPAIHFENRYRQKDGGYRWLSWTSTPDETGTLYAVARDITDAKHAEQQLETRVVERTAELHRINDDLRRQILERQRAEEALRHSQEQLRQSQKMEAVGRLAGGVAHDFNNMLTVILSYARLLASGKAGDVDRQRDCLEQIIRAGERAAALTGQLLTFSRSQPVMPGPIDLGALAMGMQNMLARLISESVDLRITAAPGITAVSADPGQIEQVLLNLAVNARDAMPDGGTLSIEVDEADLVDTTRSICGPLAPGRYVRLTVTDRGVGMTADTIAHMFEPFFTTKPRGHGTGLGLSIVFGIVQQCGGDISVSSEPGQGTKIAVYFPRAVGEVAGAPRRAATLKEPGTGTVLLVEDEDLVRRAVETILRSAGYHVLTARDPRHALQLCDIHRDRIRLLLTDVVMPGMSGRELAERIIRVYPSIQVLFMSGYSDDAILRHGSDAEVQFIAKPFTPEALAAKVGALLGGLAIPEESASNHGDRS